MEFAINMSWSYYMNRMNSKNLYTDRLELRIPTMKEQHRLWEILIDENVNR